MSAEAVFVAMSLSHTAGVIGLCGFTGCIPSAASLYVVLCAVSFF